MLQRGRLGSLHHPSREISLACEHAALDVARPILVSHRPCAGLQAYGVEQSFEDLAVEAIRSLPDDELLDDVAAVVRKRRTRATWTSASLGRERRRSRAPSPE